MSNHFKIVDLEKIIKELKETLEEIRNSDIEQRYKTQKEKRAGASAQKALRGDLRKSEKKQIKLTTLNRYLTKIRRSLSEMNYKRFDFDKQIARAIKKHPEHKERLLSYESMSLVEVVSDIKQWKKELGTPKGGSKDAIFLDGSLGKLKPLPPIFEALSLKPSDKKGFQEHQESKIEEKQARLTTLKLSTIQDVIIDLLKTSVSDPKQCEKIALGVSLACGRRQIETCYLSTFKAENDYNLLVDGIAKNKDKGATVVPTLAPTSLIIEAVNTLRNHSTMIKIREAMDSVTGELKNEAFNNSSRSFTLTAREYFNGRFGSKSDGSDWMFKDSRAIYARSAYLIYCEEQKANGEPISAEDIFYTKNLAHTDKDAQKSYKAFDVESDSSSRISAADVESVEVRTPEQRLAALRDLLSQSIIQDNKAYTNVMTKFIPMIEANPSKLITKFWLRTEVKGAKTVKLNELYDILEARDVVSV